MGMILMFKEDPVVNTFVNDSAISDDETLNLQENGFKLAFGVMDYKEMIPLQNNSHVYWNVYLEERQNFKVIKK